MKLLDSDTSVEHIRGNEQVLARLAVELGDVATTLITAGELYYGAAKSRDPEVGGASVDAFLLHFPPLTLDRASARIFGDLKSGLEREGQRLPDADLLIASICLAHGAVLVTGNRRHFDRIPGLTIEDWIDG